jgi:hypothetical protein
VYPPPLSFENVFIPKGLKIVCFDTVLEVLILKGLSVERGYCDLAAFISKAHKGYITTFSIVCQVVEYKNLTESIEPGIGGGEGSGFAGEDIVEGLAEGVDGRGLEDDVADAEGFGGLLVFGADVAGGHEDGQVWAEGAELAGKFKPGHAGHREVGDDGGELGRS